MKDKSDNRIKLAVIDLDGTLLGPDKRISPANLEALHQLHDDGLQIVLASGRHYQTMFRFLEQLPMVEWIISVQGGEISSRDRSQVLHRNFLRPGEVQRLVTEQEAYDLLAVHYCVEGVCTTSQRPEQRQLYEDLAGVAPRVIVAEDLEAMEVFKTIWIGDPEIISSVRSGHEASAGEEWLQGVQTYSRVYEFMPRTTTKAEGLQALCRHMDISPESVVAFGDAENDIPMFQWAGLSYAMPHGWPLALAAATFVGPDGDEENALARAIGAFRRRTGTL